MAIKDSFMGELKHESSLTKKMLERVPLDKKDPIVIGWKPHEKSMNMGYLTLLVADIPRWITYIIERSVIDFGTYRHFQLSTTAALVKHFDDVVDDAKRALKDVSNEELANAFT